MSGGTRSLKPHDHWESEKGLAYAQLHKVGATYGVVRQPNVHWMGAETARAFYSPGYRQDIMGGFCYHMFKRPEFWDTHERAIVLMIEAPHRHFPVDPSRFFDVNLVGLPEPVRRITVPLLIVTELSHTNTGDPALPNLSGPQQVQEEALDRGVLVLRTETDKLRTDLVKTLQGIVTGILPEKLILP